MVRFLGEKIRYVFGEFYPFVWIEKKHISKSDEDCRFQPIFIIGAPRSGTTLLYQLLAYHVQCCYFTNFASVFYKYPVVITKLTNIFNRGYSDKSFNSNYGLIKGLWAPSEAGAIFKYWFDKKEKSSKFKNHIKKSCNSLASFYNSTFISKNLLNNYRLDEIYEVFPNGLFIYIKRELLYNVQSVVLGMRKKGIGMKALRVENENGNDDIKTAINRVIAINTSIETFFKTHSCNYLTLNYHSLCKNYFHELDRIRESYNEIASVELNYKRYDRVLIKKSEKKLLSQSEWEKIQNLISKHSSHSENITRS